MKLVPFAVCISLVVLVTVPDVQSGRGKIPRRWFEKVASECGEKLVKTWHYAKCKKRGKIPKEMTKCLDFVYGCGKTELLAQQSAQAYANDEGEPGCARYMGHCEIHEYTG